MPFEYHNVDEEPDALRELLSLGFMSTPVTIIGDEKIVGFNREQLQAALRRIQR